MKIICDTNISVSAFLWSGIPNKIFKLAQERKIELCGTFETLKEFEQVINYPRLQNRINILGTTSSEIVIFYERLLTFYKETPLFKTVVIEVSITSEADNIAKRINIQCKINDYADCLHLALACVSNCNYFITCDDEIVEKDSVIESVVGRSGFTLKIRNPIDFLNELEVK